MFKKNIFQMIATALMVCVVSLSFVACGKDDKPSQSNQVTSPKSERTPPVNAQESNKLNQANTPAPQAKTDAKDAKLSTSNAGSAKITPEKPKTNSESVPAVHGKNKKDKVLKSTQAHNKQKTPESKAKQVVKIPAKHPSPKSVAKRRAPVSKASKNKTSTVNREEILAQWTNLEGKRIEVITKINTDLQNNMPFPDSFFTDLDQIHEAMTNVLLKADINAESLFQWKQLLERLRELMVKIYDYQFKGELVPNSIFIELDIVQDRMNEIVQKTLPQ